MSVLFAVLFVAIVAYIAFGFKQQPNVAVFACPFVPALPALGLFVNCYLICQLGTAAFVRLIVWTFIGFLIYIFYGIRHR